MKYRTKLYLAIIITAVISTLLCLGISYFQVSKIITNELRTNVMSVAAGTASLINKDDLISIQHARSNSTAAYDQIQQQLRTVRDDNRREDIFVKYVYIIAPRENAIDKYEYLVDAEDKNSRDYSPIGESADEADSAKLSTNFRRIYAPTDFIKDQWGTWMTAYAPIYDKNGKYIASVGVNLYADRVIAKIHKLLAYGVGSFSITLILMLLWGWFLSKRQAASLEGLHAGVKAIGGGDLAQRISMNTKDEFAELATEINTMAEGLQQRERLQLNFARYVSKHVMDSILQSGSQLSLTGERRKITLLFSDIRNFTKMSEKYPPEKVVKYLNEYFSAMVEIIFKNNGVLDKFIGDGIMVEFGVPLEDNDQELNAVKTAVEMIQAVKELCAKWKREAKNVPNIEIGVGIHTGMAVIGNIGSEKRFEYTAIGDTVNSASRIEQLTKELKTPILFSESTAQALKDKIKIKSMGAQVIRGKAEPINVYTIDET